MLNIPTALTGVPAWVWKGLFIISVLVGMSFYWYGKGQDNIQKKWDDEKSAATLGTVELKVDQGDLTIKAATDHAKSDEKIKDTGKKILSEVKNYVPSNSSYAMPPSYRVFHNAAADNIVPVSTGKSDEKGTGTGTSSTR